MGFSCPDGPKEEKRGHDDAHDAGGGGGGGRPGRLTGRGTEPMMLVMPLSEEACETFFRLAQLVLRAHKGFRV